MHSVSFCLSRRSPIGTRHVAFRRIPNHWKRQTTAAKEQTRGAHSDVFGISTRIFGNAQGWGCYSSTVQLTGDGSRAFLERGTDWRRDKWAPLLLMKQSYLASASVPMRSNGGGPPKTVKVCPPDPSLTYLFIFTKESRI